MDSKNILKHANDGLHLPQLLAQDVRVALAAKAAPILDPDGLTVKLMPKIATVL